LEFVDKIQKQTGKKLKIKFSGWRPSDQKVYISDIAKVKAGLEWQPKVNVEEGISRLVKWVKANESYFS
jgi:CDP-paratose 2-epimerase